MMNTQRVTAGKTLSKADAEGPPQGTPSPPTCQDGPVSQLTASDLSVPGGIVLTGTTLAVLFLALVVATVTLLLFVSGSASAVPTGMGCVITVLFLMVRARGRANAELVERNSELAGALGKSERRRREAEKVFMEREWTVKELQSGLKSAQLKIAGLLLERQVLSVRSETALVGTEQSPEYRRDPIPIPPNGQEAFSPVLDVGRIYNITVEGTCALIEQGSLATDKIIGYADAFYRTDNRGAFSDSHEWLLVDGHPLVALVRKGVAKIGEHDREVHRHNFQIKGSGQKVGISLRPYWGQKIIGATPNTLTLTSEMLPEGTPWRGTACENNRSVRALEAELELLRVRAHCESHFLDPAFQSEFANREREKIIQTLKPEWQDQYAKFMRKRPLKKLAEEKAPEVIEWFEARVKIVQLAERLAVAPAPERIEPTVEDARALVLSKRGDLLDEKIALMELKGQKLAKLNEAKNALPIDEDDKQRLSHLVSDSIFEEGEEHDHGKNGHTL